MSTPNRLGTPIRQSGLYQPPPPVIPTSWIAAHEQRWLFVALMGFLESTKLWDIIAPYLFSSFEPTWSTSLRVQGFWTALAWFAFEAGIFAGIKLLRIPMVSPKVLPTLAILLGWNVACWFLAEPGMFLRSIYALGPTALGAEWYWNWYYWLRRYNEPSHLAGVHKIRLLPYSTATLNPLSLSYCIPPGDNHPLYIPVVFNNSLPNEISYYIRSLETGHTDVKTIFSSSLKSHGSSGSHLSIEDDEEEDATSGALIRRSTDDKVVKHNSVKPSESFDYAPKALASTEHVRFISIDKPAIVTLKSVVDKRGDRFRIAPHKEAVITECPTGGHFVNEENGQLVPISRRKQPAELRCQGDDEVVQFQARGVGALKVGWKKEKDGKNRVSVSDGTIEGIEEDVETVDQLALVRRDKVSKSHIVPLRVYHDTPGIFDVSLVSVEDSLHNRYYPSDLSAKKAFNVIPRPSASFDASNSSPRELLVGKSTNLQINVDGLSNEPTELVFSFQPIDGEAKITTRKISKRQETITATEPGVYTLLEIKGPCGGLVKEPSSFVVQLVPPPTLEMRVETIHECAMDVGVTTSFEFNGVPPFRIEYTEQRDKLKAKTKIEKFVNHFGKIDLTPEQEGEYTYTFVSLGDAKYDQVKLDQPPIKQTVHPLATAQLLGPRRQKLYACSGNDVEVNFETKGADPLSLTYHVSYNGRVSNETWTGPPGRQSMRVPVPIELTDERGGSGKFAITLSEIVDGNGCPKRLSAPTVDVEVNRERPTVRFAKSEKVVITEGEVVKAPLRLTGQGAWDIVYSLNGQDMKPITIRDRNQELTFDKKGLYKLSKVKDHHCPGIVLDESTFEIDFKPRPSVKLVNTEGSEQRGSSLIKKTSFCAGEQDQVAISFSGQAPFELGYLYTIGGKNRNEVLKSAQETGILHLGDEAGSHYYALRELSDANYRKIPVNIGIEHTVHARPSASFSKLNTQSLCLDSQLSGNARVQLSGKAPFTIDLAVRKPASSRIDTFTVDVSGHEWTLDLPYEVKDVGRYEVTITSVKDSSGCDWQLGEKDALSTLVEVVESARIVPVSQEKDLCVGDTLDFLLQGKAPWTIEYEWLGKKHKVSSSASRFSRYAEYAGTYSVKSVALKDNQCKRQINDMVRTVHALPSVKIQEGIQSLREGDEPAAFSVKFTGEAPFSFTYTRSEQVGSKMKVVETQTITDIMDELYTITSSLPGDYAVTSVSDKYCRYPPLSRAREKS